MNIECNCKIYNFLFIVRYDVKISFILLLFCIHLISNLSEVEVTDGILEAKGVHLGPHQNAAGITILVLKMKSVNSFRIFKFMLKI